MTDGQQGHGEGRATPRGRRREPELTIVGGALLVRDEQGRLWVAPVAGGHEGGGQMPHLRAGAYANAVEVLDHVPGGLSLRVEPDRDRGEQFQLDVRAFRLSPVLAEHVAEQLGGPRP